MVFIEDGVVCLSSCHTEVPYCETLEKAWIVMSFILTLLRLLIRLITKSYCKSSVILVSKVNCWNGPKFFITQRTQKVSVSGHHSSTEEVVSGSYQGTILGPIFFLVNNIDIHEAVKQSTTFCFADDSRLLKGIRTNLDAFGLQSDLNNIMQWALDVSRHAAS